MNLKKFQFIVVFLMVIAISIVLAGSQHAIGQEGAGKLYLPMLAKPGSADPNFQLVKRFAPVLKFDGSYNGLPMSAEDYFQEMLNVPGVSPVKEGGQIHWVAEWEPEPDGLFADFQGWDAVEYYITIQTADVDGDGRDELLARHAGGMWTFRFDSTDNSWKLMAAENPPLSDAAGLDAVEYYSTIQTADIDGDGRDELLARYVNGFWTFRFDSNSNSWQWLSGPSRTEQCGRDDCRFGMSNNDFNTLVTGQVPTYYRVIDDAEGRARIAYWWFYGWQPHCNVWHAGEDGAHHGDWEHVILTTTPDREAVEWITYSFHSSSYTRKSGFFEMVGERPVVYVGKLGHGSYHSQDKSGWMVGTPHHCCEYADYRNPKAHTVWQTHLYLVDLDQNGES